MQTTYELLNAIIALSRAVWEKGGLDYKYDILIGRSGASRENDGSVNDTIAEHFCKVHPELLEDIEFTTITPTNAFSELNDLMREVLGGELRHVIETLMLQAFPLVDEQTFHVWQKKDDDLHWLCLACQSGKSTRLLDLCLTYD